MIVLWILLPIVVYGLFCWFVLLRPGNPSYLVREKPKRK